MLFFNKKRVLVILSFLTIAVIFGTIQTMPKQTVATVALPCNKKIIVLDAGHGYPDEGASSSNGISEEQINLDITLKVQKLLEQSGSTVLLTRSDENGIYDLDSKTLRKKKVSDIKNRVKIGNESQADIFVSIHLNKIPQKQYYGWQTFFKDNNENSKKLAVALQKGLNDSIQRENKRESLRIENIYIVDNVEIPISIVECGFLSNNEEEKLLQSEEYQSRLAWGIYVGIMDYFNN